MTEVFRTQAAVVGAGVVGLACARRLAMAGIETIMLEAEKDVGLGISSRNSEVIHAGLYYPAGSLKARLSIEGRRQLYRYCEERHVPHKRVGKWIVAVTRSECQYVDEIAKRAKANGVDDAYLIDGPQAASIEPQLVCEKALVSPSTGIVDTHAFMHSLLGDFQSLGGTLVVNSPVDSIEKHGAAFMLQIAGREPSRLSARYVVNAAGLNAPVLTRNIPRGDFPVSRKFAKGSYFSYQGQVPFQRLIYPVPQPGGLGVHLTLDLAGQARFGPDVEWLDEPTYDVTHDKQPAFAEAIRRYWPACDAERLVPAYAGVRPKVEVGGRLVEDFIIAGCESHGIEGLVDLCGIESPGLTASMAIADKAIVQLNLR